jgi:2-polyprenyl-3-methyl-5-hydroxy-6-metoxy-1,4-benzoquinol methylase
MLFVYKLKVREYYARLTMNSTFVSKEEMFMCCLFPEKVLSILLEDINPQSILDVGCGTGRALAFFFKHNIDVTGIENSKIAIELSEVNKYIKRHNLNKVIDLKRKFDLVWCFEVIEHIHPKYESNFLKTLTNHSNLIIISAAQPGQGGFGHFNEQPPEYWIKRFSEYGYTYDSHYSNKLRSTGEAHADNILCFKK